MYQLFVFEVKLLKRSQIFIITHGRQSGSALHSKRVYFKEI